MWLRRLQTAVQGVMKLASDSLSTAPGLGFEEAYGQLQEVVERLEKGNLPLDESLALFEQGTQLVRRCSAVLGEAELKVNLLTADLEADLNQERRRAATFGLAEDEAGDEDSE